MTGEPKNLTDAKKVVSKLPGVKKFKSFQEAMDDITKTMEEQHAVVTAKLIGAGGR